MYILILIILETISCILNRKELCKCDSVIDLNSRREFNYYRKTNILFIIEEL